MFAFPSEYTRTLSTYPSSTLDEMMEFLYQYRYLEINGDGNTPLRKSIKDNDIYFKFVNEYTVNLFRILLVLHMENAISLSLRLPKKSEGFIKPGFVDLLKPYNEQIGLFKSVINTEDLFNDFDHLIKSKIHNQDTIFIDFIIHGYRFINLFFTLIAEEKGCDFEGTQDEKRLLDRISNMIEKNPDYTGEISLYYNIEDYLEKDYLSYPVIYSLHQKRYLDVKEIIIKAKEIKITLHRFNNFPITKDTMPIDTEMIRTENLSIEISQEIEELQFIFHNENQELVYGKILHKFRKDSLIYKLTQRAFEIDTNVQIWYDDVYGRNVDFAKSGKQQSKEISTAITKYNKIFEEKFGVKNFFGRESGSYYRRY